MKNKLKEIINIQKVKKQINECPTGKTVLITSDWTGNRPEYTKEELSCLNDLDDINQIEQEIGLPLIVTENDDLVVDPHCLIEEEW